MSRRRRPHEGILTPDEARRAIYIDFEGPAPRELHDDALEDPDAPRGLVELPPTLLGILSEQDWQQVIVDPDFFGIADHWADTYRHVSRASRLPRVHKELVQRCLGESRVLAAFGNRELLALLQFGDLEIEEETRAVFRDAEPTLHIALAESNCRFERHTLKYYRKRYGVEPMPEHLDRRKTGGRIADVRKVVTAPRNEGGFGQNAPAAKGKWTKVKQRNHRDCWDLRQMALIAAGRSR